MQIQAAALWHEYQCGTLAIQNDFCREGQRLSQESPDGADATAGRGAAGGDGSSDLSAPGLRPDPLSHMQSMCCRAKGVDPKTVRREHPPDNPEIRLEMNKIAEKRGRKRARGSRTPMPVPLRPNQRWSLDFLSDTFGACRKFRILAVNDDCCRKKSGADCRHQHLGRARRAGIGRPAQDLWQTRLHSF
jgi:hypothetical protein